MANKSKPPTRPPLFSFDAVAESFDAASGFPLEAGDRIRDAIQSVVGAGPTTRFLELGAGTGLIAWPFIKAGAWYTAVDASAEMIRQLHSKFGDAFYPATLLIHELNDRLPFPNAGYHVIIASRVLHRLDLEHILPEIRRTLRPEGYLLMGRVQRPSGSLRMTLRRTLRSMMKEMGFEPWPPAGIERTILARLEALGGKARGEVRAFSWTATQTARETLDLWSARAGFGAQVLPPDLKAEMLRRLNAWILGTYGSLDYAEMVEQHYVLNVVQF